MKNPTIETQMGLEELFNKQQLLPVLIEEFADIANSYEVESEREFLLDALVQIYLHKQADAPTMVGILSPKFGEPQVVADRLLQIVEKDYIDFNMSLGEKGMFITKYDIPDEVKNMLERYKYPLQMVTKPKKIKNNFTTGYHTINGSIVLNGSNWFDKVDLCKDHLNKTNQVALSLNQAVIDSPEGKFTKPVRKQGEDFKDFQQRYKQADTFYNVSMQVMEVVGNLSNEFYMTHKYDRRGRCYSSGYHINTQGDSYRKAVIEFAEKELISDSYS